MQHADSASDERIRYQNKSIPTGNDFPLLNTIESFLNTSVRLPQTKLTYPTEYIKILNVK